jgi:hypothetical protein
VAKLVLRAGYTEPSEADDLAHVLVWLLDHCAVPNVGDARGMLA